MCAAPGGKALLLLGMVLGAVSPPLLGPHHHQQHAQQQRQQAHDVEDAPLVQQPGGLHAGPMPNNSPYSSSISTALVVNDRSSTKASRLAVVMRQYLPPEQLAAVSVTSHDGTR
jgi:hypothetical protein